MAAPPPPAVPVKLFANFRKVRALTRDASCISEALKGSQELVLSEDGKRVSAGCKAGTSERLDLVIWVAWVSSTRLLPLWVLPGACWALKCTALSDIQCPPQVELGTNVPNN
jgi:hypothetical protein